VVIGLSPAGKMVKWFQETYHDKFDKSPKIIALNVREFELAEENYRGLHGPLKDVAEGHVKAFREEYGFVRGCVYIRGSIIVCFEV
jgi:hypothetical protein